MTERIAHAKINLALHVTGQREDGYHLLDTVVVFAEYGDLVSVQKPHHPHSPVDVTVDGPFSDYLTSGGENLVTSAALLLRETVRRSGGEPAPVSIRLVKNLPIASGIGGGSADAAATLQALQEFWGCDADLVPIAHSLGADVEMCLHAQPLRAQGIGDQITPLKETQSFPIVLVNPGVEVSTPAIFKALSNKDQKAISESNLEYFPSLCELKGLRNDLELPAKQLAPEIDAVLNALSKVQPELVRMSGSGATCFGIFETGEEAEAARASICEAFPEWWCVATRTTVS